MLDFFLLEYLRMSKSIINFAKEKIKQKKKDYGKNKDYHTYKNTETFSCT